MTLICLKRGLPIKAAATFGAITDLKAYQEADPRAASMSSQIWPDIAEHRDTILDSRSAQLWPDQINAPILLMHGEKDPQVSPLQTLKFAEKLSQAGKAFGVIIYPGDNHILAQHRNERDQRVGEWFRSFLHQ